MNASARELLIAIAFAPPGDVTPSERLKALAMLRDAEPPPEPADVDSLAAVPAAELDAQLDALWVVDVVQAVASGMVVNGVDPASFPATAAVLRRLLRDVGQAGGSSGFVATG